MPQNVQGVTAAVTDGECCCTNPFISPLSSLNSIGPKVQLLQWLLHLGRISGRYHDWLPSGPDGKSVCGQRFPLVRAAEVS
jgi:hypothetical protein